ncbi:MAG: 1-deoxy-D-xylulose-5-phosphate reductoisomerase [Burkholderia sp.]|nr:1-deoxy-D-xylulose-5-phosphate reductoisomerase [Burkholderia sp.]
MQKRLTLLGSTGSIGVSTLDVVSRHPERFLVYALTAHRNVDKLVKQCIRFNPEVSVVCDAQTAAKLEENLRIAGCVTQVAYGPQALVDVSESQNCDIVVAAIVGAAGLIPTLAAARAGKKILLANKESLVMCGSIFMDTVRKNGAILLPVDSEHNAVFQCIPREVSEYNGISKITLTGSGGPFRTRQISTLGSVTPDDACRHPNWVMGRKISIDSATMMNKGLEIIEAHWIFGLPVNQIGVLIHPQSIVHSLVSYKDGSVLAQLGNPDMRTPIAHALAFPERVDSGVRPLVLSEIAKLSFEEPDYTRFPCLVLALNAITSGGIASTVLNATNEIAVQAFLDRRITFTAIAETVDAVLSTVQNRVPSGLDDVLEADSRARHLASEWIAKHL